MIPGHLYGGVVSLLASLFAILLCRLIFARKESWDPGFTSTYIGTDVFLGLFAAIFILGTGFLILLVTDQLEITGYGIDPRILIIGLIQYLLVALSEEILCRGYLLYNLMRITNRYAALVITSLIFSILHFFNPDFTFFSFFSIFLAGILLGISYIYTRSLWFSVSLHLFWNYIQGPILGFPVSGSKGSESFLNLHIYEKNIFTGGDFGFEGSLYCILLILVVIPCLACYY
ncbi:MAG: CPBP family intramembrane metalloprotease, partial [Bacteroides sp.]|nr:CPBP family intramembrane metalloprotease [Bacteroides sp.]